MIQENRAFKEMLKVAKEWLSGKDPVEIEKKTGIFIIEKVHVFV